MDDSSQQAKAPPQSFLRRLLLLVVASVALIGIGLLINAFAYLVEMSFARTIRQHGGRVEIADTTPYSFQEAYGRRLPFFDRVTSVTLVNPDTPLEILKNISSLKSVRKINVSGTGANDDVVAKLRMLSEIRSLDLSDTQVTDVGLKRLNGMSTLRSLSLAGTKITDDGLMAVGRKWDPSFEGEVPMCLWDLEQISIAQTDVTDAGLLYLTGLSRLKRVDVRDTRVTIEGVRALRRAIRECEIIW